MKYYFSLDVESVGLFGRPFAAGWVVVDETGQELEQGYLAYAVDLLAETDQWIIDNVMPALPLLPKSETVWDVHRTSRAHYANCSCDYDLYRRFWTSWTEAKQRYPGVVMVADCPWPVEANFLLRCWQEIGFDMQDSVYPLIDVASVVLAAGGDPLGSFERLPNELPQHHPTADARQSARILVQQLKYINGIQTVWAAHTGRLVFDSDPDSDPEVTISSVAYHDGLQSETVTYSAEGRDDD